MRPAQQVLIVEDSYLLLEIVAQLCEREGAQVVEASSGEAALTVLRQRGGGIDWLFCDIHLPGLIDGWTVAEAFRALNPAGAVVYTSTGPAGHPRALPGSLYLRKPFRVREVEDMIRLMAAGVERRIAV